MTRTGKQAPPKKERKPKNPNLRNKAYKFRIYPTQKQIGTLEWTLRRCKELYNAALEERREAYRKPKQDEETGQYLPNGAAAKGGLNKSILDAGWGAFITMCSHKAEEAGGTVVKVAPHGTSQACSGCGCIVPKNLEERWHSCPHCGCELDRDHNAALNILHRYFKQKSGGAGSVPQRSPRGRAVEAPGF